MRFATNFEYQNLPMNDKADEFNIFYSKEDNSLNALVDFIAAYKDKQVNIRFRNAIDVKIASTLAKLGDNVRFVLDAKDMGRIQELKKDECKYFLVPSLAACSFTQLEYQVETLGVSEVYVIDDLAYNLPIVSRWCNERGVRLRVVLNRPLSSVPKALSDTFFCRPEDMDRLSLYFDTGEFAVGEDKAYDFKRADVLYRAFYERKYWHGNLAEIIDGLPDVPNTGLTQTYTRNKVDCRHKCISENSPCQHCRNYMDIAKLLNEKNIKVV